MFGRRAKPETFQETKAAPARDEMGSYPSKVDTHNNRFMRSYRNIRVQHIIIGSLLVMNIAQAASIMTLLPLYKIVPVMITVSDKEEQVVRAQPIADTAPSALFLIEKEVRQYVKERHTVSQDDAINLGRWSQSVKQMSSDGVFEGFMVETKPILESAKLGKFTRAITIDSAQKTEGGTPRSGTIWRVDFTAYDRTVGQGLADTQETRKAFTVEMRVMLLPREVTYSQRFVNPLGFKVMSYSVVPRRLGTASIN
jgi:type IV secretory pathway component VirB8